MHPRRLVVALVSAVAVLAALPAWADETGPPTYDDPDYLAFDLDNMARTTERQGYQATTPSYLEAARETFADTFLQGVNRQLRDADEGRAYAGVGQLVPGGNVGDPESYHDGPRHEVEFLNREGTKLVGNVWPCRAFLEAGEACPLVVVTTGSIQVTQHMYGWLARHLQDHGYTVFTFDVRGQGESETTDQADPFGSNPQDEANFVDGTVDALRFARSSRESPYDDPSAPGSGVQHHWNPIAAAVDRDHVALVGHSLGASAVTTVQQCTSTPAVGGLVEPLPAACDEERFPIRAIVAYDRLGTSEHPRVPAFSHEADGYFINAVPTPTAPDPDSSVDVASNFGRWVASGNDALKIVGRGFTHAEWSQIPAIASATRYGVPQAEHYTLAWLDRYVHPDGQVRRGGHQRLLEGPLPQEPAGEHLDHRASLFSGKLRSAARIARQGDLAPLFASDLRFHAGVAPVGDWTAINAEREYGTAARGAVHETLWPAG